MLKIPNRTEIDDIESKLNTDYVVTVNGLDCKVCSCRVSAIPFNRTWPGKQRSIDETKISSFISFSSDEEVVFAVKCAKEIKNPTIRPLVKNITIKEDNGTLFFTLKEKGQYVLETNGSNSVLHIFINEIKEYDTVGATYYFGPGFHVPTLISLKDNDIIYVDDEAVVFTSIIGENVENIRIFGGGILNGRCENRIIEHCYKSFTKGNLRLYNCKNVSIEGVIFQDSSTWAVSMFECENININNIKIIGQWRYNTDGIDIVNSSNIKITDSFIRSFDDGITVKGIYNYDKIIENILIDNCVVWCDWGQTIEAVGLETSVKEIKNIKVNNCFLIHNYSALAIQNGNEAKVHDIVYSQIYIEFKKDTSAMMYQKCDEEKFVPINLKNPILINCANNKFIQKEFEDRGVGEIYDIIFKNIYVYADENIQPRIIFCSQNSDKRFENFTVENLYFNGKKVSDLDGKLLFSIDGKTKNFNLL